MDKQLMRKQFLALRKARPAEERAKKSAAIQKAILHSKAYQNADWLFTYINMGAEVETIPLIEQAWRDGKEVAVPVAKANRVMYFVKITTLDGMHRTKLGVYEPDIPMEEQVFPTKDTLFLVPGSVFDRQKNRCGYGGGYYDTYTETHQVQHTVGICYDFQVAPAIPVEPFDWPLSLIYTERRTIF